MSARAVSTNAAAGFGPITIFLIVLGACRNEVAPESFGASPPSRGPTGTFKPPDDFFGISRCPGTEVPAELTTCADDFSGGQLSSGACEYGHDLDAACNEHVTCRSGRWAARQRTSCYGRCPAAFEDIVPGALCGDATMGCSYTRGTCACVSSAPSGGDGRDAGGGRDGGPASGTWVCAGPPGGGCPAQRPAIGIDCVQSMTCDYGSCTLRRDLTFTCGAGAWFQADTTLCR